ncbi:hypothetical protein M6D81_20270 [Paenibacillus sp. J5C_2022]|nr:hypothetical protein [Paenibacillus sp. J5C2022]
MKDQNTMSRLRDLANTCDEAIQQLIQQLNKGQLDGSIALFTDIVAACYSMEASLRAMSAQYDISGMEEVIVALRGALSELTAAYEQQQLLLAQQLAVEEVQPAYREWKEKADMLLSSSL